MRAVYISISVTELRPCISLEAALDLVTGTRKGKDCSAFQLIAALKKPIQNGPLSHVFLKSQNRTYYNKISKRQY